MIVSWKYIANKSGYTNMMEYLNNMSKTQTIPRNISYDVVGKIIDSGDIYYPSTWRNEVFYDAWGKPIIITLTTNFNGEIGILLHSFGKNKKNNNGGRDDIVMWFNIDLDDNIGD